MPKRSNPFQRLVYLLKKELEPEATVTESEEPLHDVTGDPRELDVLIEKVSGPAQIRIGIECRDHAEAQDVTWVEQVITKHKHLGTTASVLVSSKGFTSGATKLAEAYGISLLQLEEALEQDWSVILKNLQTLFCGRVDLTPEKVYAHLASHPTVRAGPPNPDLAVCDRDRNPRCSMRELIQSGLRQHLPDVLRKATAGANGRGEFKFLLAEPVWLADLAGTFHEIIAFSGELSWRAPARIPVPLKLGRLDDVPVAYGSGSNPTTNVELQMMRTSSGAPAAFVKIKEGKITHEIQMQWAGPKDLIASETE